MTYRVEMIKGTKLPMNNNLHVLQAWRIDLRSYCLIRGGCYELLLDAVNTHTHTVNAINKSLAEPNLQMSEEAADSLSLGLD